MELALAVGSIVISCVTRKRAVVAPSIEYTKPSSHSFHSSC